RLEQRGVEDRPQVDQPAEQEKPQHGGEHELQDGGEPAPLQQLTQPGDEETRQCGKHVAGAALSSTHAITPVWPSPAGICGPGRRGTRAVTSAVQGHPVSPSSSGSSSSDFSSAANDTPSLS